MPHTVALQADASILVGGQVECPNLQLCFGIARYRPNGSLDASFGTSGIARATFPGSRCGCEIQDLAVQRNGRIVAVGWRFRGGDAQDDMLLAVARFLPNGRLDASFSRDGRLSLDFGYGDDLGSAVAVQRDGRIVVGGVASLSVPNRGRFRSAPTSAERHARPDVLARRHPERELRRTAIRRRLRARSPAGRPHRGSGPVGGGLSAGGSAHRGSSSQPQRQPGPAIRQAAAQAGAERGLRTRRAGRRRRRNHRRRACV